MSANTFGQRFRVTSFGESHGTALGAVVDGCPAGVRFEESLLLKNLARRRPGNHQNLNQEKLVSQRKESDQPEILSGIFDGKTLGTPIAIIVRNQDARSQDYENLPTRRGHADDLWLSKFGHSDPRGGGRASGRETVTRVLAGSVAEMFLKQQIPDLKVVAFASAIGKIQLTDQEIHNLQTDSITTDQVDEFSARLPKKDSGVEGYLLSLNEAGDSCGGEVLIKIENAPKNLGQPIFHKLKGDLTAALMSIGAVSGVQLGWMNDLNAEGRSFHSRDGDQYGGIRGGISTGENLLLKVNFKPTSSVAEVAKKGRHDPCIVPRAIPVVEAMINLVMADHWLWQRTDRI